MCANPVFDRREEESHILGVRYISINGFDIFKVEKMGFVREDT